MSTLTTVQIPTVRPFQPEDAEQLVNRDGRQCSVSHLLMQSGNGPSWTAVIDGRAVAAAGIVIPWPGLGMAWMVVQDGASIPPLWLTRTVKRFLNALVQRHALRRLEAVAIQDSVMNARWLEAIGFTIERLGVARRYLEDGHSVVRYERIEG